MDKEKEDLCNSLIDEIIEVYGFSRASARLIVDRAYELSERDGLEAIHCTVMFLSNFATDFMGTTF